MHQLTRNQLILQDQMVALDKLLYATHSKVLYAAFRAVRIALNGLAKEPIPDMAYVTAKRYYMKEMNTRIKDVFDNELVMRMYQAEVLANVRKTSNRYNQYVADSIGIAPNGRNYGVPAEIEQFFTKPSTELADMILNFKAAPYLQDFIMDTDNLFTKRLGNLNNKSIKSLYKALGSSIARRTRKEFSQMYLEGTHPKDITIEMAKKWGFGGNSTNKTKLNRQARSQARALYNTTVTVVREQQRALVEEGYKDYIKGFVFDAVNDLRTTDVCLSLDNKFFGSPEYKNREAVCRAGKCPPLHFNCRSILYPVPYEPNIKWVLVSTEEINDGTQIKETWEKRAYFE